MTDPAMKQGGQCRPVSFSRLNLWLLDRGTPQRFTPEKAKPRLLEVLRNRPPLRFYACKVVGNHAGGSSAFSGLSARAPCYAEIYADHSTIQLQIFAGYCFMTGGMHAMNVTPRQWQLDERVFRHQPPIPSGCPQLPVRQGLYWNRWRQQLRLCLNTQQPGMSLTT